MGKDLVYGVPLSGHTAQVTAVRFSPDRTRLVSASKDGTIRLWNLESEDHTPVILEPTSSNGKPSKSEMMTCVEFSPDGTIIASASSGGSVLFWDGKSGHIFANRLVHTDKVHSVAFSPDGTVLASASYDMTVILWDARRYYQIGKSLRGHKSPPGVAFSPDGSTLVTSSAHNILHTWDLKGKQIRTLGKAPFFADSMSREKAPVCNPTFSVDKTTLVSASALSSKHMLCIWDSKGKMIGEPLRGHQDHISFIQFSPDGTKIASASYDCAVRLWDVKTGEPIGNPLVGHRDRVNALAFSPDGSRLVSVSSDKSIRIWNVASRSLSGSPQTVHSGPITTVAFSSDGLFFATGGGSGSDSDNSSMLFIWTWRPTSDDDFASLPKRDPTASESLPTSDQVSIPSDKGLDATPSSSGIRALWPISPRTKARVIAEAPVEGFTETRTRITKAAAQALGIAEDIAREVLTTGVPFLRFAPIPGLELAGQTLLAIWTAFEQVQTNRVACLRLTDRCADLLLSIEEELASAGDAVRKELQTPLERLERSFKDFHGFLVKHASMRFLERYLWREKVLLEIADCDTRLRDASAAFDLAIQIRNMRLQNENAAVINRIKDELTRKNEAKAKLEEQIVRKQENERDRALDFANLKQLQRAAVDTSDDHTLVDIFQVEIDEMPEAIKALENAIDNGKETRNFKSSNGHESTLVNHWAVANDDLDLRFMRTGVDALRRLSTTAGADMDLPYWTIPRFDIHVEKKIGGGSFSSVHRGFWKDKTVAIKMLTNATTRRLFVKEMGIWKGLSHENVVQLYGASSATSEPPWFFVSPYYQKGSLVKYLKGLEDTEKVDEVRMMRDIAEGMVYLHKKGILHGDLKATNILVADDLHCVITDFGQSEMKDEVYRLTGLSMTRGTLRWQAPELMRGQSGLTQAIDVYAFAICCIEIVSRGELPWTGRDDDAVRHCILVEEQRPPFSRRETLPQQVMAIIEDSWHQLSASRPSFQEISRRLEDYRNAAANPASSLSAPAVPIPPSPPAATRTPSLSGAASPAFPVVASSLHSSPATASPAPVLPAAASSTPPSLSTRKFSSKNPFYTALPSTPSTVASSRPVMIPAGTSQDDMSLSHPPSRSYTASSTSSPHSSLGQGGESVVSSFEPLPKTAMIDPATRPLPATPTETSLSISPSVPSSASKSFGDLKPSDLAPLTSSSIDPSVSSAHSQQYPTSLVKALAPKTASSEVTSSDLPSSMQRDTKSAASLAPRPQHDPPPPLVQSPTPNADDDFTPSGLTPSSQSGDREASSSPSAPNAPSPQPSAPTRPTLLRPTTPPSLRLGSWPPLSPLGVPEWTTPWQQDLSPAASPPRVLLSSLPRKPRSPSPSLSNPWTRSSSPHGSPERSRAQSARSQSSSPRGHIDALSTAWRERSHSLSSEPLNPARAPPRAPESIASEHISRSHNDRPSSPEQSVHQSSPKYVVPSSRSSSASPAQFPEELPSLSPVTFEMVLDGPASSQSTLTPAGTFRRGRPPVRGPRPVSVSMPFDPVESPAPTYGSRPLPTAPLPTVPLPDTPEMSRNPFAFRDKEAVKTTFIQPAEERGRSEKSVCPSSLPTSSAPPSENDTFESIFRELVQTYEAKV